MPWKASSVMEERLRFVARLLEGEAIVQCGDRARAVMKGVNNKGEKVDARPARIRLLDREKPGGLKIGGAWQNGENPEQPHRGLLDIFMERYVRGDAKLRSADLIESIFVRLVYPEIGELGIYDVRVGTRPQRPARHAHRSSGALQQGRHRAMAGQT